MAFAQLTYRESLRDIEACLRAVQPKLYHVGIRERVSRSTLADANETRDWRIYADVAHGLIRTGRELYVNEPLAVDLANTVYALDATIIDLCLSVFPWARYRRRDAAVKLHTQVDLRGLIPTVVHITERKRADVTFVDDLVIEPGAIYIMDRGDVDFERLHRFTDEAAFFLTRTKKGIRFGPRVSRPVDFATGLQSDHTVGLATAMDVVSLERCPVNIDDVGRHSKCPFDEMWTRPVINLRSQPSQASAHTATYEQP